MNEKVLKFTIPKGSLQEEVTSFFERAGLKLKFVSKRDYRPSVGDPEIYAKWIRFRNFRN
ncbi:MAG: hypothetical protein ACW99L_14180 [Promethearchaeota archaeon]|jgi:ATP phosphoribosyltransferase